MKGYVQVYRNLNKKLDDGLAGKPAPVSVSYTHLTLPTNREV
mgnify:CR=1 FL=1